MKDLSTAPFTFTVLLSAEAHHLAEQFRQHQKQPRKGKQIYLNTLAVYAVKFYLSCLGIQTDWEGSDSFNPVAQTLMDVADLQVENLGKLECRPVLPGEELVSIPPEVWSNRIGYIVVQMTNSLSEAILIGFLTAAEREEVPLGELRPLEEFPEYFSELSQPKAVNLRKWLQNIFDASWQAVETILPSRQPELAYNFRGSNGVRRGKLLQLEKGGEQVSLCVGVKAEDETETNILVEVYPSGDRTYLPSELQVMVLDAEGVSVMEAQARTTKNIQFEFSGEVGERFSVKLALGDAIVTEAFLI